MIIIVAVKKMINCFAQNVILLNIEFYKLELDQMNVNVILGGMIQVLSNVKFVITLGYIYIKIKLNFSS